MKSNISLHSSSRRSMSPEPTVVSELSEYSEVSEVWDVSDESKSKLLSKHSSTPG